MTTLNNKTLGDDGELSEQSITDGSPSQFVSPTAHVTYRKVIVPENNDTEMSRELKAFQISIKEMLETWFAKQDQRMDKLGSDVEDIKSSIKFLSDKYEDLHKRTDDIERRVISLENQSSSVVKKTSDLEAKVDSMEQQARHCNIEISNLPEKRNENLISLMESIATTIKQPTPTQYITSIHRVPQANPRSHQPKNVVVRFSNQVIRDNFITAVRRNKGVTSEQLGLSGPPIKIYVNEHLTLKNKTLFREAREAARKHGYRYIWIKHGQILVRAKDTSPVFAIRSQEDILKIKPQEQ